MNFADILIARSREKNSVLCVGLDPNLDYFPRFLSNDLKEKDYKGIADCIVSYNRAVIDSICDCALAVKPQLAYYEPYGSEGIRALEQTIAYARSRGLIVINDAKRNDIGPSAQAYARAHLGTGPISADMVTVTPYLGRDGYQPFIDAARDNNKGIFILLKTSNPSSSEIQDLALNNGKTVYQEMCHHFLPLTEQTRGDQGYSFIGFVVGATWPAIARDIRGLLPHSLFLAPGLGAQGGNAEDLSVFFDRSGQGAVVSSSRAITYAYMKNHDHWQNIELPEMKKCIRDQALKDNSVLNTIRHRTGV